MIIMPEKLQELMDELKKTSAETYYHSLHVKALCIKMIKLMNSRKFSDFTAEETASISKGALLHDIGKLFVKNVILTKEHKLTPEEMTDIVNHTKFGFEAVCDVLTGDEYEIIKNICLYHHERIDGSGYEKKTDIPLYVQIVSACDVFDALNSDRIYRKGFSRDETIKIIESGQCGAFSKEVIEYLKEVTAEDDE